ncbi:MAG TPA: MBL fold metallo-hydrolase [Beijerinckiaceae bacterium]|nr:MBL fold metallo-hydrolase [Beijerinckiaceae bacterium]
MNLIRRAVVAGLATAPLLGRASQGQGAPNLGPNRLVLLGNKGGPAIRAYAPSPSANLLVWNNVPYVIDAGYGVTFKLVEAKSPLPLLRYIFITHHHSDHNLEAGPLAYNAWAIGLKTPVDIYGPNGVDQLIDGFFASSKFDIETRIVDEGRPDLRRLVTTHAYSEGKVFADQGVTVTALRNKHPPIVDSFALKCDLGGKVIVFSGDTTYFPPLADFAKGADILVHEVAYAPALEALAARNPNGATLLEHLKAAHTMAEDVGRIAKTAGVKQFVLNHFVPADDKKLTDEWTAAARTTFDGPIIVGRDLLEIPLA